MISDTERREVALRLREHRGARLFTGEDVERLIGIELSGFRPKDADNSYNRLADLIEPSDHIGDSDKMVDRDALLALAEDVTKAAAMATAVDASKGAEMLAELLLDIARRIREACGEVVG